jgi:two-component system, sensor histidine kinase PdtaS
MPGNCVDRIFDPEIIATSTSIAEANHRIANNLAIIAWLIRREVATLTTQARADAGHARRLLQQMFLRIDAVARLHRLLMDTSHGSAVELCAYLREIVDAAACSLTTAEQTRILCRFETEIIVSAKKAAAIGMFVSEALVNSIKHAHPFDRTGTIWVSCGPALPGKLRIEIADDGRAAPSHFGPTEGRALGSGVRLMRNIADDLGAHLEFTKGQPGHTVRLELPLSVCLNGPSPILECSCS